MTTKPVLGISGCLTGSAVRFDGGHKRMGFVMDELAEWVNFRPVCPEMAIGLPTPRPALRLTKTTSGEIQMRFSKAPHEDVTQKMADFAAGYVPKMGDLCGFIVCAKSPSCGMERVRLYDEKGNAGQKEGVGLFTAALLEKWPWLPVEEDGRLHDPVLRENFVERVFALHELNTLRANGLTRHALLDFPQPLQTPAAGTPSGGLPRNWPLRRLAARVGRSGSLLRGVPRKTDGDPQETRLTEKPHQRADAYSGLFP